MHETLAVSKCQEVSVDNMGSYLRVHNFSTTHIVLYLYFFSYIKNGNYFIITVHYPSYEILFFLSLCNFSQHLTVLFVVISNCILLLPLPYIYTHIKF